MQYTAFGRLGFIDVSEKLHKSGVLMFKSRVAVAVKDCWRVPHLFSSWLINVFVTSRITPKTPPHCSVVCSVFHKFVYRIKFSAPQQDFHGKMKPKTQCFGFTCEISHQLEHNESSSLCRTADKATKPWWRTWADQQSQI